MPSMCASMRALHAKHTADGCHHCILLCPTAGHKAQIDDSGVSMLSSYPIQETMESALAKEEIKITVKS